MYCFEWKTGEQIKSLKKNQIDLVEDLLISSNIYIEAKSISSSTLLNTP